MTSTVLPVFTWRKCNVSTVSGSFSVRVDEGTGKVQYVSLYNNVTSVYIFIGC